MMTVLKKARGFQNNLFYTTGFRKVLEDHLPYLRNHPSTGRKQLTLAEADRYKWNLSAYLATVVSPDLVWVTMRLNGFLNDLEYDGSKMYMLIPGNAVIDDLVQRYLEKLSRTV